ncbi:hypothetical protein LCGC14_1625630 [marine sediment metagenome]|uniref:Uncharacterized protein n=1 Tax=marine sediment metagenome TaxID=412755 RepID=A0A0F9L3V7_9ZZZZ
MPLGSIAVEVPDRTRKSGHRTTSVTTIIGPREAGPFSTTEEVERLVVHTLAFHKTIQAVYCLGDNIPPIAIAVGQYASGGAAGHDENDTTVSYCLDGYGFNSLGNAIIYAIALRDRCNPNDARYTATAIDRLLTAPQD